MYYCAVIGNVFSLAFVIFLYEEKRKLMKKKIGLIAGGVVIVAVAIIVIVLIKIGYENNDALEVNLKSTWVVYQYGADKIDNEYMIFTENKVSDYRDGNVEPFVKSSYTYKDGLLNMPEISREFTIKVISDYNIVLVEPNTKEWKMVRVASSDEPIKKIGAKDIVGDYTVISVAGEKRNNEFMSFTGSSLVDTRDGKEYLACDYTLDSETHLLHANQIDKDFLVYMNGNYLLMIDISDRYVWELAKK